MVAFEAKIAVDHGTTSLYWSSTGSVVVVQVVVTGVIVASVVVARVAVASIWY